MLPADFRAHSTSRQYFPRCNNATASVFLHGRGSMPSTWCPNTVSSCAWRAEGAAGAFPYMLACK